MGLAISGLISGVFGPFDRFVPDGGAGGALCLGVSPGEGFWEKQTNDPNKTIATEHRLSRRKVLPFMGRLLCEISVDYVMRLGNLLRDFVGL